MDAEPEPPPYGRLPVGSGRRVWARRTADEAEAKAIASSLRLRILRITLHEPRTNQEIAEALGRNPASLADPPATVRQIAQSVGRRPPP